MDEIKPTEHRGVDNNGNPDDKFTEKEALAMAKKEGVEFVDFWVVKDAVLTTVSEHPTQEEAEKAAKKGQTIAQVRRVKGEDE